MEHLSQFIINHWGLWLALIIILLLIFINELQAQKKQAKSLSPQAAVDLINHENAVVIDLRDAEAYRSGHIVGSIRASADDFNQNKMNKYKSAQLILVCPKGLQSATLATKLREQGFENAMVLNGGITGWQAVNLPLVKKSKGD